jgi:hypothetical protein
MTRYISCGRGSLATLGFALALTSFRGTAAAETQAEIANRLNEEGKQLMYADQPAEAAKKFQEAVARVPEAKYFINLCTARLQEGQLGEALTACQAVDLNSPTADQKSKAGKLVERINEEAKKQHVELCATGGGGGDPGVRTGEGGCSTEPPRPDGTPPPPNGTAPPPRPQPAVGRPLGQSLVMATRPDNRYTWTLGIDLFGGGGRVGQPDWYGSSTAGFRIKSDVLFNPAQRIGAQFYVQVNHLDKGKDQMSVDVDSLDIVDVGAALYKHFCLGGTPRLCITPLAGLHLSLMSPANNTDGTGSQVFNYAAGGGRGEVALTYAFGYRYEHALSLVGGVNVYSAVFSAPSRDDESSLGSARDVGLDTAGAVGYLGLGYTYRFNTPLGSSPFVTLE